MPKIRMPDGAVVAFPDDMPPEQIKSMIASKFPDLAPAPEPVAAPAPTPDYGSDMLKSAGSGLRSGVEGLVGAIGSANEAGGDLVAWTAGKMGAGEGTQDMLRTFARRANLNGWAPSTGEIGQVTDSLIGERYQPQTTPGEYVRTVSEFAPSAALGPGGFLRKTAMAAVPGIVSETAGQVTEGTAAEPYARLGGALLGGGLAAGRGPSAVKIAAKDAPTKQALKAETDALYDALRKAGIRYDADSYGQTVLSMASDLKKAGFRPVGRMKEAFDWVEELAKDVGKSPDFDDINSLRQSISGAARDAYKNPETQSLGKALDIVADHLDEFEGGAPFISNVPIPKENFDAIRSRARSSALKSIKQRALDDIMAKAETYQSGRDAGIRNGIGNLLRSKRGMQLFNADERKLLLDVQHNRKTLRSLSKFGIDFEKWSGNATLLPTLGAGTAGSAAAAMGAPASLIAGGLVGAGTAAKFAAPRLTARDLERVGASIRGAGVSSKTTKQAQKLLRQQRLIRQLLTAGAAQSQSRRVPLEITVTPRD